MEKDEMIDEFKKINTQLIEQEHRIIPLIKNYLKYGTGANTSDHKKKRASRLALILNIFFSTGSVLAAGVTITAITGLFFARKANILIAEQNELVAIQNKRVEQQNLLMEAERRSSLINLMGNIMDNIELNYDSNNGVLNNVTIARISSLGNSLKPYKYLKEKELSSFEISGERGQLLRTLINAKLAQESIFRILKMTKFDHSDLFGVNFNYYNLKGISLRFADMRYSKFKETNFSKGDFRSCLFWHSECDSTNFKSSYLRLADFKFANIINANFEDAILLEADLRYTKGNEINVLGASLDSALVSEKDFIFRLDENSKDYFNNKYFIDSTSTLIDSLRNEKYYYVIKRELF